VAPEYAGSRACSGCHQAIYQNFAKSAMGRSMSLVTPGAQPAAAAVTSAQWNRSWEVRQEGSHLFQTESAPGLFSVKHRLLYAIGSGVNGRSYVVQRGAHLFQAPLSFYARTNSWQLSPGYEHGDYGFSRPILAGCVTCHSGRPRAVEGRNGLFGTPPFEELAIGCENCHGPGQAHILARGARSRIVNPARLPVRLAENICMRCHQGGDARVLLPGKTWGDFQPGQWLGDTVAIVKLAAAYRDEDLLEHHTAMEMSRCFQASQGKLSCLSCHDPHTSRRGPGAAAFYRSRCQTCHSGGDHSRSSTDCVSCHMPSRGVAMIAHSALTNHRIIRQRGQPFAPPPASEPFVHVNQTGKPLPPVTLLRIYGELMEKEPSLRQRYVELLDQMDSRPPHDGFFHAAQGRRLLAEAGANDRAVASLRRAVDLGYPSDVDLSEALSRAGRPEEALGVLERAREREPYTPTLYKALALRYIQLKRYPLARQTMERHLGLFPEDDFVRGLLAKVQ
jgi:tetratricopeptide (TPR) repeat protein